MVKRVTTNLTQSLLQAFHVAIDQNMQTEEDKKEHGRVGDEKTDGCSTRSPDRQLVRYDTVVAHGEELHQREGRLYRKYFEIFCKIWKYFSKF